MENIGLSYGRVFAFAAANSIAAPLGAETIKVGASGGALDTIRLLAAAFIKDQPKSAIVVASGLGSGGGRRTLIGNALDLRIAARPGKAVEKLDGATARLYGRAPFGFAVLAKNPIGNLSIPDIIDIFGGKIWVESELGKSSTFYFTLAGTETKYV